MEWKSLRIFPENTIHEALKHIDFSGVQFAIITDRQDVLIGVVTDGNIRRGLLAGLPLESPVTMVMNPAPRVVDARISAIRAMQIMEEAEFTHLPVVSPEGKLLHVWSRKEMQSTSPLPNAVVLMAGGLGSRLGELTKQCPKPMLPVGGKPILEIVLQHFMEAGFRNFYFAINYLAEKITAHFGDGSHFQCHIQYLHESKRMGTAGALSLLPPLSDSFLVANADILAQLNMRYLLSEHMAVKSPATMVVKRYEMQVPYGVVDKNEKGDMLGIQEKPEFSFCVSAGMYALSPEVQSLVPQDTFFDMPELFQKLLAQGKKPHVLETDGYWLDIGRVGDFERAQVEYEGSQNA